MANLGSFDAELRNLAWFDPELLPEGWYDYSLPFDHPYIAAPSAPAAPPIPELSLIVLQSVSNAASF